MRPAPRTEMIAMICSFLSAREVSPRAASVAHDPMFVRARTDGAGRFDRSRPAGYLLANERFSGHEPLSADRAPDVAAGLGALRSADRPLRQRARRGALARFVPA